MASTTHNKRLFSFTDGFTVQNAGIEAALRETIYQASEMFERVRVAFVRRRVMSAAFRELSEMSDRELADIGIARNDIRAVAKGTYKPRD